MVLPALSTIRGHRMQVALLQRLLAGDRMGHAYLFTGPDAVGKRSVALALLARLSCLQPVVGTPDPCGHCRSCTAFLRGDHPDVLTLVRDGEFIKIEQIRELNQRLRYEPVLGRIKGVLIDGAETLIDAGANALLKTLEEPSAATVFVLISAKPQLVIDTICSRCQPVRFGELAPDDVAALLVAEGVEPGAAQVASALAEGSIKQGRALVDPGRLAVLDLAAELVLSLGLVPPTDAAFWPDRLGKALKAAESAGNDDEDAAPADGQPNTRGELARKDLVMCAEATRAVLRDALLVACGVDVAALPYARHGVALVALARRSDATRIAQAIDVIGQFEAKLTLNPNVKLAWTALMIEVAAKLA